MVDGTSLDAEGRRKMLIADLLALQHNGQFTLAQVAFNMMLYCDACVADPTVCADARARYTEARAGFNTIWAENDK